MPSESVATFLDQARARRVIHPDQIDQLIGQPDAPQDNLDELCAYLERRQLLTRFQADMVRGGRGDELVFAGYPVTDDLGPCPGGHAYMARHPSLRTPVVIRRLRAEALAPADNAAALIARARAASPIQHAHLVPLLDAGFYQEEPYAAIEWVESADLDSLVKDIGPMPTFLACEYARQATQALRVAHERGAVHGDVRPANLYVAPVSTSTKPGPGGKPRRRPSSTASVRVAELGLTPIRPPASVQTPPDDVLPYLPPERVDAQFYDPRGDLYGIGATLYYLLTGRPPFAGPSDEVLDKVRASDPTPLDVLRPDVPPDLVTLVKQLMAKRPDVRPQTAADLDAKLAVFGRPGAAPAAAQSTSASAVPMAAPVSAVNLSDDAANGGGGGYNGLVAIPASPTSGVGLGDLPPPDNGWSDAAAGMSGAFTRAHDEAAAAEPKPKKVITKAERMRMRMWMFAGLGMHLTATALLIAWLTGAFDRRPDPAPPTKAPLKPGAKKMKSNNT